MKVHRTKTDNYKVDSKINLRTEAISKIQNGEKPRVLDLFAGENKLWDNFEKEKYYGIEKEKGKGRNLYGDNVKVIPSLDLSKFNIIDCDSYGIPYEQIFLLFQNPTLKKGTVVIYTCISNSMSRMSKICMQRNNLERIYKKTQVLLNKKAIEYFFDLLYENGIKEVREYEIKKNFIKKYGYFIV